MALLINTPSVVKAAGNKPKIIEEYVGKVASKTDSVSIARMKSPQGWTEPGQKPEFDEYTLVLKGLIRVRTKNEVFEVKEGQAVVVERGEWVQYSTPEENGAEYIAVCLPAFTLDRANRDENLYPTRPSSPK